MKRILITGEKSYIGTSLKEYLVNRYDEYEVDCISVKDDNWKNKDFGQYNVVFHVAAIVHKRESPEMKGLYNKINRELTIEIARKAKDSGVSQFIFMSSMAVYGEEGKIGKDVVINNKTPLNPRSYYAESKVQAEIELNNLKNNQFNIVILRPPIVYGPSCPGNYAKLVKIAQKSPVFPMINNKRSMIHIDNLCCDIKHYIDNKSTGLFFPQDEQYVNTSLMVKKLAKENGRAIYLSKIAGFIIVMFGNRNTLLNKVFGNLVYEKVKK